DYVGVRWSLLEYSNPGGRLFLEGDLHDLFAVDAVAADRLADPDVAEDRMRRAVLGHRLGVLRDRDLHHRHHGRRLFPGHDLGTGILRLERLDVLGRKVDDEVDLSGLEGRHLSDGVLDHADYDAVQVGEPLIV